jgi:hypothetical protein
MGDLHGKLELDDGDIQGIAAKPRIWRSRKR